MGDTGKNVRDLLLTLTPSARATLRTVLTRNDGAGDGVAAELVLLRYGDTNGDGWVDVIDILTMYPDVRPKVVRLLAEMRAVGSAAQLSR